MYYIYILYNQEADKFYVGYSADPWERLVQHNNNSADKFTGKFKDWILAAVFQASIDKSVAIRLERFIKKQKSKSLILKLIDPNFCPSGELAQLVRVPQMRD